MTLFYAHPDLVAKNMIKNNSGMNFLNISFQQHKGFDLCLSEKQGRPKQEPSVWCSQNAINGMISESSFSLSPTKNHCIPLYMSGRSKIENKTALFYAHPDLVTKNMIKNDSGMNFLNISFRQHKGFDLCLSEKQGRPKQEPSVWCSQNAINGMISESSFSLSPTKNHCIPLYMS